MAGFRFSLEPVLAYRKSLVELLQMELAVLEQRASQARLVRDALMAEIEQGNASLRDLLGQGRLDMDAVVRLGVYRQALSTRLQQQRAIVADLEAQVADKREELLKVQQDQEMLDALKRRQWQRFQQRLEQAEVRLIDESAIAGFNRRRMADGR